MQSAYKEDRLLKIAIAMSFDAYAPIIDSCLKD